MRFIHSSDWQIGKTFSFADDETLGLLQNERLDVIPRIGRLAREQGAPTVLVAGDIYDTASPSARTLQQPLERMRQFPDLRWHLIPGNHDPNLPDGIWARAQRFGVPENVQLHLEPGAAEIGEGSWVLPAVLSRRHMMGDTTAYMDEAITPEGAIRIGLAHGSVTEFGSEPGETHNRIAPDRARRAGLAYMALGDWHGFNRIDERCYYSGTPECDRFDTGGGGGGETLLVAVDGPNAVPQVTRHRTGRFLWQRMTATLTSREDIDALDARLRGVDPDDPSRVLVALAVSGALTMEGLAAYDRQILQAAGSALRMLRIDGAPDFVASVDDPDFFGASGAVRNAAEKLRDIAATDEGRRSVAQAALHRLGLLYRAEAGQ